MCGREVGMWAVGRRGQTGRLVAQVGGQFDGLLEALFELLQNRPR